MTISKLQILMQYTMEICSLWSTRMWGSDTARSRAGVCVWRTPQLLAWSSLEQSLRLDTLLGLWEWGETPLLFGTTASPSWMWASKVPVQKYSQQHPGLCQEEHCQQIVTGDSSPLLSSGETHVEFWVQFWGSQYRRERDILKQVQWRAMEMTKGLKCQP